jgi:hypothetical protein
MLMVKTVWVILMENYNWTGNNAGAAFGDPDLKGNPLVVQSFRNSHFVFCLLGIRILSEDALSKLISSFFSYGWCCYWFQSFMRSSSSG